MALHLAFQKSLPLHYFQGYFQNVNHLLHLPVTACVQHTLDFSPKSPSFLGLMTFFKPGFEMAKLIIKWEPPQNT